MNKLKNKLDKIAIGISIFALSISLWSAIISQKSHNLSREQYLQERSLILKAEFDNGFISIKPFDNKFILNMARFYLPASLTESPLEMNAKGGIKSSQMILNKISEQIQTKYSGEDGYIKIYETIIPIAINSYYTVIGNSYSDTSIYLLTVRGLIYEEKWRTPKMDYVSMMFYARLFDNVKPELLPKSLEELKMIEGLAVPALRQ